MRITGCKITMERDMTKRKKIVGYYGYYNSKLKRRVFKTLYEKIN